MVAQAFYYSHEAGEVAAINLGPVAIKDNCIPAAVNVITFGETGYTDG